MGVVENEEVLKERAGVEGEGMKRITCENGEMILMADKKWQLETEYVNRSEK